MSACTPASNRPAHPSLPSTTPGRTSTPLRPTLPMNACSSASTRSKAIWYASSASSSLPLQATAGGGGGGVWASMRVYAGPGPGPAETSGRYTEAGRSQAQQAVPQTRHAAPAAAAGQASRTGWPQARGLSGTGTAHAARPPQQAEQDGGHLLRIIQEHEAAADGGVVGGRYALVKPHHQAQNLQVQCGTTRQRCSATGGAQAATAAHAFAPGAGGSPGSGGGEPRPSFRGGHRASTLSGQSRHTPGCGSRGSPPASG